MAETRPQSNIDVDFLPATYREQSAQRKSNGWRIMVIFAFTGTVVVAALLQRGQLQQLEQELADLQPQRKAAQQLSERLATLREEYEEVQARAQVATFLNHPWPRTQVLYAVLDPLPKSITLRELSLVGEAKSQPQSELGARPTSDDTAQTAEPPARPELQDLKRLHEQYNGRRTVLLLSGIASEFADLHHYLEEVARHPLIAKAELVSAEQDRDDALQSGTGFEVRILVRPGYGLPDGPAQPPVKELAERNSGGTRPGA